MLARLRVSFLAILLAVLLTSALASTPTSPFPCTGTVAPSTSPPTQWTACCFRTQISCTTSSSSNASLPLSSMQIPVARQLMNLVCCSLSVGWKLHIGT
ncbi:hypothetical protein PtrV1_02893 [Pyrenophora tritici-repentis]|nr:hypothetical protein PtrV1_02893 [Pyrenophora tritici-repentis]